MKENWLEIVRRAFAYGGVEKREFEDVRQDLNRTNREILFFTGCTCMILFLGMFVSTFWSTDAGGLLDLRLRSRYVYLFLTMGCALIAVIAKWVLPKRKSWVLPLCYLFMSVLYAFAIWGGTFNQPYYPSVTFCVFLMVLPLLIMERPWRLNLYLIFVCGIYLCCSRKCKEKDVFQLDVLNCLCFFYLSMAVGLLIQWTRIRGAVQKKIIENQRDQDPLSGLLSRAALERDITHSLKLGDQGAFLIMDIDDFKQINDTYGHIYGDAAIRAVGECVQKAFSVNAIVGRFGGDEFVVYIRKISGKQEIVERLTELKTLLRENLVLPSRSSSLTVSVGIGFWSEDQNTFTRLLESADKALYQAKRQGKNQYFFSEESFYKKD